MCISHQINSGTSLIKGTLNKGHLSIKLFGLYRTVAIQFHLLERTLEPLYNSKISSSQLQIVHHLEIPLDSVTILCDKLDNKLFSITFWRQTSLIYETRLPHHSHVPIEFLFYINPNDRNSYSLVFICLINSVAGTWLSIV